MLTERIVAHLVGLLKEYGPQPALMIKGMVWTDNPRRKHAESILEGLVQRGVLCKINMMWGPFDEPRKMMVCYGVKGYLKKRPWREREAERRKAVMAS